MNVAVVGGGPAGLIAAETLARGGASVVVHDRMRVVGRKFLLAGRGGLNLTNDEPLDQLVGRYGGAELIADAVRRFPPASLRSWAASLDEPTFVGTSGRVFPRSMHATALLRAWLARLRDLGVVFSRDELVSVALDPSASAAVRLRLRSEGNERELSYDAAVLALGGASWPRLGADGSWVEPLRSVGVDVRTLVASNSGVVVAWPAFIAERFAGEPLKNVRMSVGRRSVRGEAMITRRSLEGGVVYAFGRDIREAIERDGSVVVHLDLRPDVAADELVARLARAKPSMTLANRLRRVGLPPAATALVRWQLERSGDRGDDAVVRALKDVQLTVHATAGLDRAISAAGGIALHELDEHFMLRRLPGVFAVGEMLDWDAPTGGYLLQACFASGVAAAHGVLAWCLDRGPKARLGSDVLDEKGSPT